MAAVPNTQVDSFLAIRTNLHNSPAIKSHSLAKEKTAIVLFHAKLDKKQIKRLTSFSTDKVRAAINFILISWSDQSFFLFSLHGSRSTNAKT